jgi:hypothetical protein
MKTVNSPQPNRAAAVRTFAEYADDFEYELMRAANEVDDMLEVLNVDCDDAKELDAIRFEIGELRNLIVDYRWNHLRLMLKGKEQQHERPSAIH